MNLVVLWATLTEFRTVGPFELNWETQQYKCWISQGITFALLASLQAVNLFWLFLILRIAKNYVFTKEELADERSEGEDDDDDDDDDDELEEETTRKMLERQQGMKTDKPVVLVNGNPIEANVAQATAAGIMEKKKDK